MQAFEAPIFCNLELTFACNNLCLGCGNVFARQRAFSATQSQPHPLTATQWCYVLEVLMPGIQHANLTGGEPVLHPEFDMIAHCVDGEGIPFCVFSNGRWPEPQKVISLLGSLPNFCGFLISLHGATASVHETFTGVLGSFQETTENIRLAVKAGLRVTTNTIITGHNYNCLGDIVTFFQDLGVRSFAFNRYLGSSIPGLTANDAELRFAVQQINALKSRGLQVKLGVCIPQCFEPSFSRQCMAGFASVTVDPWGNVRPCNHTPLRVGSILCEDLSVIWNSLPMQQWRDYVPAECGNCVAFSWCNAGCRAAGNGNCTYRDLLIYPGGRFSLDNMLMLEELDLYPIPIYMINPETSLDCSVLPFSSTAYVVLNACDGHTSLRGVIEQLDENQVQVLGLLRHLGLVTLLDGSASNSPQVRESINMDNSIVRFIWGLDVAGDCAECGDC